MHTEPEHKAEPRRLTEHEIEAVGGGMPAGCLGVAPMVQVAMAVRIATALAGGLFNPF